jgi:hypothetical protein
MRMPALHLRDEALGDVVQSERAAFLRDDGVKEDLEQQVAQLFPQPGIVAREERVIHFVCFLDEVRAQRLMRLGGVPLTAPPQIAHEDEGFFERRFHVSPERRKWGMGIQPFA